MKIWLRVCPPSSPGRGSIKVSATNYQKKGYYSAFFQNLGNHYLLPFSFLYNLRFLQTKDMRHTLDPLHCYSLGIHRNAGRVTLQMLGRCSEAAGVDVVHYENMQKELS